MKSKIWIEVGERVLLGKGRVCSLSAIRETGSRSKAARYMPMSYKKAGLPIRVVNKSGKKPVVTTHIGGKMAAVLCGNALVEALK